MSTIRAAGYRLTDVERLAQALGIKDFRARDDNAFQMLLGDVQRIKQELRLGSNSGAGGTSTRYLAAGDITSDDGSVTVANDLINGLVDLAVPAPTTFNSRAFAGTMSASLGSGASPTTVTLTGTGFSSNTYTFPVAGTVFIYQNMSIAGAPTAGEQWVVLGQQNDTGTLKTFWHNSSTHLPFSIDVLVSGSRATSFRGMVANVSAGTTWSFTMQYSVTSIVGFVGVTSVTVDGQLGGFYLST